MKTTLNKTEITECKDLYEVLEKSKMNFFPVETEISDSKGGIEGYKSIRRSDNNNLLSVQKNTYGCIKPLKSFSLVDNLVKENNYSYDNIISVNGGQKIRISASSEIFQFGNDSYRKQINFIDSYNGSTSLQVDFSLQRAVCDNLQIWEDKSVESKIKLRHTLSIDSKFNSTVSVIGKSNLFFGMFLEKIDYLEKKVIDHNQVEKMLNGLLDIKLGEEVSTRKENQKEKITSLFANGKGNNGKTAYDLYNGVTDYYDHFGSDKTDNNLNSSIFGNGKSQKNKAFNMLLEV